MTIHLPMSSDEERSDTVARDCHALYSDVLTLRDRYADPAMRPYLFDVHNESQLWAAHGLIMSLLAQMKREQPNKDAA